MADLLLGPELFRVTVDGQPYGAGSKSAIPVTRGPKGPLVFRNPPRIAGGQVWGQPIINQRPSSKYTEPWMETVEVVAGAKWGGRAPIDGALWLDVFFYERRTKGHFFADGRLKPDAPAHPHATDSHDVDKLRRAISDSLTNAKVLADDKRVIGGNEWKLFCDNPRRRPCAVIIVGRMEHQTALEAGLVSPPPEGQEQLL